MEKALYVLLTSLLTSSTEIDASRCFWQVAKFWRTARTTLAMERSSLLLRTSALFFAPSSDANRALPILIVIFKPENAF